MIDESLGECLGVVGVLVDYLIRVFWFGCGWGEVCLVGIEPNNH